MPRNEAQVNALIAQLKTARDGMELDLEASAVAEETAGNLVNARRLRSFREDSQRLNDVEITVQDHVHYDDDGYVMGISRVQQAIEDTPEGPGLRSLLGSNRANVDQDGDLVIDGVKIKRHRPAR